MFLLLFLLIIILIIILVAITIAIIASDEDEWRPFIAFFPIAIIILIGFDIVIYNTEDIRWINSTEIMTEYSMVKNITVNSIELINDEKIPFNQGKIFNKKYPLKNKKFKVGDLVRYQYIDTGLKDFYVDIKYFININNIDKNK